MANSESASAVKFREPAPLTITGQTKLEDWKKWLQSYRWYAGAMNLVNKSHQEQISIFKSLIGPDAMKIYDTFSLLDVTDVESVIQKFEEHFTPKVNITVERLKFNRMTQQPGQNFEDFLAEVTKQAANCNFGSLLNDFLLDKIVVGVFDEEVREALLSDEELNYDRALQICRASEKRHFMSKIDIGEANKDQKAGSQEKPEKPRRQSGPTKPLKNAQAKPPKKAKKFVTVEEVPELSMTTRKRAQNLITPVKEDKELAKEDAASVDATRNETSINVRTTVQSDDGIHDSEDDSIKDSDDFIVDDDEIDKTFEPEIKIRVKNFKNVRRKRKKKRLSAPKTLVPPGEKPFSCHHCGFKCANKGYIRKHMNIHVGEKLYACDQCDYKSIRPQGLFRHKFRHTGEKPYACEVCEFRCSHQSSMKKHMMGHTGEKPHACDLCDYRAIVADKLKMHRMKHHTGEKPFACASCSFACTHKGNLKNHMLTHSETRPFACDVCDRRFNSNFHLKQHTLTHTGERPFACHICDFRSAQLGGLRTHLKRHTGEKPHVCHICGHRTSLKGNLKKHMLTHTGEKPYACTICSYRSAQSSGLKTHMKVHTGEKPYVCDMCGYRCATNGNLKQHMKTHKNRLAAPEPPPSEAPPQWHESFPSSNPGHCGFPTQENQQQQPVQALYLACQGAQREPVIAERRSITQREWPNQNPDPDHNHSINLGQSTTMSHNQNQGLISLSTRCIQPPNQNTNPNLSHGQNQTLHSSLSHSNVVNLGQGNMSHGHTVSLSHSQNPDLHHSSNPHAHCLDRNCCGSSKDPGMHIPSSGP